MKKNTGLLALAASALAGSVARLDMLGSRDQIYLKPSDKVKALDEETKMLERLEKIGDKKPIKGSGGPASNGLKGLPRSERMARRRAEQLSRRPYVNSQSRARAVAFAPLPDRRSKSIEKLHRDIWRSQFGKHPGPFQSPAKGKAA